MYVYLKNNWLQIFLFLKPFEYYHLYIEAYQFSFNYLLISQIL